VNVHKKISLLILTVFLLVLIPSTFAIPFFNNTFDLRQEFNLTANYTIDTLTNLSNYTAYLSFDTNTLISQGKLNADCSDIRITDSNNNELNFEIEKLTCDNSLGTPIYIRFPELVHETESSENQNRIFVYYSSINAQAKPVEFTENAWDKRYEVYHIHNNSRFDSVDGSVVAATMNIFPPEADMPLGNMLNITGETASDIEPFSKFPFDNVTNITLEVMHKIRVSVGLNDEITVLGRSLKNGITGKRSGGNVQTYSARGQRTGSGVTVATITPSFEMNTPHYTTATWEQVKPPGNSIIKATFDGVNKGTIGTSTTGWQFGITEPDVLAVNDGTTSSTRGFRGELTEIKISRNFSQTGTPEYGFMQGNIYLNNAEFWAAGSEEGLIDNAPQMSLSISATNIDSGLPVQINAECTDDFALVNMTIESDSIGSFEQVEFKASSGVLDTLSHDDISVDGSIVTVNFRATCFDDAGQSIVNTVSYTTNRILPLQGVTEIVAMAALILLFIGFFVAMIKKGK